MLEFEDRIVKDEIVVFDTLLRFKKSSELFAFLHLAKKHNCTVVFSNEEIKILPQNEMQPDVIMTISVYFLLHNSGEHFIWKYYNAVNLLAKDVHEMKL